MVCQKTSVLVELVQLILFDDVDQLLSVVLVRGVSRPLEPRGPLAVIFLVLLQAPITLDLQQLAVLAPAFPRVFKHPEHIESPIIGVVAAGTAPALGLALDAEVIVAL